MTSQLPKLAMRPQNTSQSRRTRLPTSGSPYGTSNVRKALRAPKLSHSRLRLSLGFCCAPETRANTVPQCTQGLRSTTSLFASLTWHEVGPSLTPMCRNATKALCKWLDGLRVSGLAFNMGRSKAVTSGRLGIPPETARGQQTCEASVVVSVVSLALALGKLTCSCATRSGERGAGPTIRLAVLHLPAQPT